MALVNERTICKICGEPLGADPRVGFKHFVRNRLDPLFLFTDSAFHRSCFYGHPLHEQAISRLEERERRFRNRVCAVCDEPITGGYYTTGFLTDDQGSPLYDLNYLFFHREHIAQWPRLVEFEGLVSRLIKDGKYQGPSILP